MWTVRQWRSSIDLKTLVWILGVGNIAPRFWSILTARCCSRNIFPVPTYPKAVRLKFVDCYLSALNLLSTTKHFHWENFHSLDIFYIFVPFSVNTRDGCEGNSGSETFGPACLSSTTMPFRSQSDASLKFSTLF